MDFSALYGNERLKEHLHKAIAENRLSHAYLITGEEGMGKRTLAMVFAKALRCTGATPPCGSCGNCQDFELGKFHPDIVFLRPAQNSKGEEKRSVGVDDLRREVLEPLRLRPDGTGKKVFILEKAHLLTVQAQNALLKSLEEPPAYAVFLLLADHTDSLLPTVLSRVVQLRMSPLAEPFIAAKVEEALGVSPQRAQTAAAHANGNLGKALTLAGSEAFAQMEADVAQWASRIEAEDMLSVMSMAEEMKKYSRQPEFLELFLLRYRDGLVYLLTDKEDLLISHGAQVSSAGTTAAQCFTRVEAVQTAAARLAQNGNFVLTMESMLRTLKESYQ